MAIDLLAPETFTSAMLIADTFHAPGGSPDAIPILTRYPGSNNPVSAALEIQSILGGLLLPRLTTSQMNDLLPVNGLMIYNSTIGAVYVFAGGVWASAGGGGGGSVTSLTPASANIVLTPNPITATGTIGLNTTLTGMVSVAIGNTTITNGFISQASGQLLIEGVAAITIGADNGRLSLVSIGDSIRLNATAGPIEIRSGTIANPLRFYNSASTFYTGLVAGAPAANVTYTLPAVDGTSGQLLVTNGSGTLSFSSAIPSLASLTLTGGFVDHVNTLPTTAAAGLPITVSYTALATDSVIAPHSNIARTVIALPASPIKGQTYKIVDVDGNASNNPIYLNGQGVEVNNQVADQVQLSHITTGATPQISAVTPNGNYIFIPNSTGTTVTVLQNASTATPIFLATLTVGTAPTSVAITPDGNYAYVTNSGSATVSVITGASSGSPVVSGTLSPTGSTPTDIKITPDGNRAYIANSLGTTVTILTGVSTATPTVSQLSVVDSFPKTLAITPDGNHVFVPCSGSASVRVITNASSGTPALLGGALSVGTSPQYLSITPDGNYVYVSNSGASTVSVISAASTTTPVVLKTITVGSSPGLTSITPNGNLVYVPNAGGTTVSVISNASTAASLVQTSITVGTAPQFSGISRDGNTVYVSNVTTNTVSVIKNASSLNPLPTLTYTFGTGTAPQYITVTPNGANAYISNFGSGNVSVINSVYYGTGKTLNSYKSLTTGTTPTLYTQGFTPDSDTLLVANGGSANVSIFRGFNSGNPTLFSTVAVGTTPNYISITPNGNMAYVSNTVGDSVSIIQNASGASPGVPSVLTTIAVGDLPLSGCITPDGNNYFVPCNNSDNVYVIEGASTLTPAKIAAGTPAGSVGVGDGPFMAAVTPNGKYVYVTNNIGGTISVIKDAMTNNPTVTATLTADTGTGVIAITPDGNFAYATNYTASRLTRIQNASTDSPTTIVSALVTGNNPTHVTISPDGNYAYVVNFTGSSISAVKDVSTTTASIFTTISLGYNPIYASFSVDGYFLYVTSNTAGLLTVIKNASSLTPTILTTIPVPGTSIQSIVRSPNGNFMAVASNNTASVNLFNTSTHYPAIGNNSGRSSVVYDGTRWNAGASLA